MAFQADGRRVGYVVSRFPKLSETFVLREMNALEDEGWDVRLYPLLTGEHDVVHAEAAPWLQRTPRLPLLSGSVVLANLSWLLRRPRRCAGTWLTVLRGFAGSPRALVRALVLLPSSVHLATVVRRDEVPHLHAHFATYPMLAAWVVHRLTGTPFSVTVHAHDLFTDNPLLARRLEDAAFVVAISEYNRAFLGREVDSRLLDRTVVVHCGVDPSAYGWSGSPPAQDDVLDVLCVGSLQQYKGQAHLVAACRLLLDRGVRVRCRLVGDGPDRDALRRSVDAAGLTGVVDMLGPCTETQVAGT